MSFDVQRRIREDTNNLHKDYNELNKFFETMGEMDAQVTKENKEGTKVSARKLPPIRGTGTTKEPAKKSPSSSTEIFDEQEIDDQQKLKCEKLKENGNLAFRRKDYKIAILFYRRCLALREDPVVYCNIGLALEREGDFEEAEGNYRASLSLDHTYLKAYYRLAIILRKVKKYRESVDFLNKYLVIKPGVKAVMKELETTKQLWKEFLENQPRNTMAFEVEDSSEEKEDDSDEQHKSEEAKNDDETSGKDGIRIIPDTKILEEEEVVEEEEEEIEEFVTPEVQKSRRVNYAQNIRERIQQEKEEELKKIREEARRKQLEMDQLKKRKQDIEEKRRKLLEQQQQKEKKKSELLQQQQKEEIEKKVQKPTEKKKKKKEEEKPVQKEVKVVEEEEEVLELELPKHVPRSFSEFEITIRDLSEEKKYQYVDMIMKANKKRSKNGKFFRMLFKYHLSDSIIRILLKTIINYYFKKNDSESIGCSYDIIRFMRKVERAETVIQFIDEDIKKDFYHVFNELERRIKNTKKKERLKQNSKVYMNLFD